MDQEEDIFKPLEKIFSKHIKPLQNLQILSSIKQQNYIIVINGFPYDEGTRRNGGRVGGEKASSSFRKSLDTETIYPTTSIIQKLNIYDSGDIAKFKDNDKNQELSLEEAHILQNHQNAIPFLIGGSNDQSYYNAKGLLDFYSSDKIAVINLDAHFDVRPLVEGKSHSGSPFRQMLEDDVFQKNQSIFVEFASKGCSCSANHHKYLLEKKCDVYWLEKNIRRFRLDENNQEIRTQAGQLMQQILAKLSDQVQHIFFSFDVDSINSAYCPGVSAPSVIGGLTDQEAIELSYLAGKCSKVKQMDMSEFNPAVEDDRTSKLLVTMFYYFCKGVSERQQ